MTALVILCTCAMGTAWNYIYLVFCAVRNIKPAPGTSVKGKRHSPKKASPKKPVKKSKKEKAKQKKKDEDGVDETAPKSKKVKKSK